MSSKPTLDDISLLVIEPGEPESSRLLEVLDKAEIRGTRSVVTNSNDALREMANKPYRVCLFSAEIPISDQLDLLKELSNSKFAEHTALIATIPKEQQAELVSLMKAGAHAVELSPVSENRMEKAILRASYKLLERIRLGPSGSEQVTNISWLLENVATRLEQLAGKIEERDALDSSLSANPKLVKEALLSAVGASGAEADQFSDDFIKWLETKINK